ncbi:glycosyltransferase family 4 protein [Nitrobacter sp. Nb-311A]|uniref:glycosyltransferase family 4 protein n=1 Tax=Nitrobacter sp. Nb-311A TaxID=314253 RepID=UPI000323D2D8|nr:glycosyltransferase family 4 protein [Nitrobacter sp. Nb-311A]
MKIAMLVPSWPPGNLANGIVTYANYMVRELRRQGHEVYILTANASITEVGTIDLKRYQRPRSLWRRLIFRLAPDRASWCERTELIVKAITELKRTSGLEVLEIENSFGLSLALSETKRLPIVVRLHGPWFLSKTERRPVYDAIREYLEGRALRSAQVISSPSRNIGNAVSKRYGSKITYRVFSNPIDVPTERWSVDSCKKHSLLFVGRFDLLKGADLIFRAFAKVAETHPETSLTFVGPDCGIEGQTISQFAVQMLSEKAIRKFRFLGPLPRDSLAELRVSHFVTICASRSEVQPYSILEAMSFGCPIISSGVGGIPEMIDSGRSGILFPSEDVQALTAAIRMLLEHPEIAAKLGASARAQCINYEPAKMAVSALQTYKAAVTKFHESV